MERNAVKWRELEKNAEKCREMKGNGSNSKNCREMQWNVEKFREMQRNSEKYRESQVLGTPCNVSSEMFSVQLIVELIHPRTPNGQAWSDVGFENYHRRFQWWISQCAVLSRISLFSLPFLTVSHPVKSCGHVHYTAVCSFKKARWRLGGWGGEVVRRSNAQVEPWL